MALKAHRHSVVIGDVCQDDRSTLECPAASQLCEDNEAARNAYCTIQLFKTVDGTLEAATAVFQVKGITR